MGYIRSMIGLKMFFLTRAFILWRAKENNFTNTNTDEKSEFKE